MSALIAAVAAIAVRNPFWPIGYEGVREQISAEPKVEVQTAAAAEADETATAASVAATVAALEQTNESISTRNWIEAKKALRISGTTVVTDIETGRQKQAVIINGYSYGDGDLVSFNHEGRRFTWRIKGLSDGSTLKLVRVRAKQLDEELDEKQGEAK